MAARKVEAIKLVILLSMAVAVVSFFLPWVQLFPPSSKKARFTKVTISLNGAVRLSGYQLPRVANSEAAKTAFQLAELFQKKKSDFRDQLRKAGARTYLVYLLPLFHIMLGAVLLKRPGIRWMVGVAGFAAFIIPPIGFWQVSTALAQSKGLVATDYGLRLSLLAYWGLTYAAAHILRRSRVAVIPK